MNLSELLVNHPLRHPDSSLTPKPWVTYSPEAVEREYSLLGVIEDISVMLHNRGSHCVGLLAHTDSSGRYPAVFRLHFKQDHRLNFDLPAREVLQVDLAETKPGWSNTAVMSQVYEMIVGHGVTLK